MVRFAACAALCCLLATSLMAAPTKSAAALNALAEEYMRAFYGFSPSLATRAGVHQYDSQMEDLSRESFDKQIAAYADFEKRFAALSTVGLSEAELADREMMLARVRAGLFDIDGNRWWDSNPDRYSAIVSDSAFVLMQRNFAPAEVRLAALVARERKMPLVFAAARANLKDPPRVYTQVAIDQLPGIIAFFEKDVPEAFAPVKDAKLQAEFKATNQRVVQAMEQYLDFLKEDLLAKSNGDFRIGAEKYAKKLAYEEMVDIPLDRLLQVGRENLQRNQQEFARVAKLIDPSRTPQEISKELQKEHPAPDKLLEAFRSRLSGLRTYIAEKKIMTTPAQTMPMVEETPPFMRALTFASMDAPGPFETHATEAYFNVTLPEKNWTPEQIEEHMQGFNYGTITSTSVHETFPGHYEQYLWNERLHSKIRKFLALDMTTIGGHFSGSNQEGWAHYTEQMMLDEGYGRTAGVAEERDKEFLKLRIGQLQEALLRNARYIIGIEMHTGKMTFDQAVEFFQKEGYQTKATATSETKRGTSDPTYLVYTLGKLEILKLRDDYKKKMGAKFTLQDFHDRLMEQGVAPLKVIRRSMLGNDSPAL
jgi:uncharacterized protein (DUF885 family)